MVTLAEYARDPRRRTELVNGVIIEGSLTPRGQITAARMLTGILEQHGLISGMRANLILDDSDPLRPLVREPDVYVLREENDPEDDGLFQRAENVLLVVEVRSPSSGITDWVEKMSEYADAGIPRYWIIEFFNGVPHLCTFGLKPGGYGEREHWDKDVDIEVAGVRVRFDLRDLV
ncbi:MAG TPA: Uma2 family endonuclease [Actinocrinis sp.]|uniref:Uma2 family endonuclease n=1 Tax=Actinocrinis sp. TaxID=1920516 RepID=UPI002DDD8B3D|nr:Uma2 family endonuclease [Actinocrinis sp.]HEV2343381.1 Uma2 family endonuclease [Actinocrinis sp.]